MSNGARALKSGLLRNPVYSEIRRATINSQCLVPVSPSPEFLANSRVPPTLGTRSRVRASGSSEKYFLNEEQSWRCRGKNFFYSAYDSVLQHDFDSVGMVGRFRENLLHDAFGQLAGALILLFYDPDTHSRSYVGASLSVHAGTYFFGEIFVTVRPMASAA